MNKLEVKLDSVVSEAKVNIALPTFVQTQGLPQDDALAFVKDCADGKRKIAKAVRNKYEGTSGTASEITEYSTFDELSDKISQIPIEVPLGSAMEQNGGVLPFYDVYNKTLKAMKEFAGYGFNGCCAFELDKWSYDNDHTITLSGADAYYTSDGTFIKDNIIYKNGTQIGELDNSLYRFQDQDAENTNRFVVYFFVNERYQVPKTLHATSCLNLWCIKGTPKINFSGDFTALNSINVYDGELDVLSESDFLYKNNKTIAKAVFNHIKSIKTSYAFNANTSSYILILPNLEVISGGSNTFYGTRPIFRFELPNIKIIKSNNCFNNLHDTKEIILPKLERVEGQDIFSPCASLETIEMPSLVYTKYGLGYNCNNLKEIKLGNPKGGEINIGNLSQITSLTIEKGFASKLDVSKCSKLEREVLVGIINNLADLTSETSLNLIMGSTLLAKLTDEDKAIATQKNWTLS